ncbi:uncharacterized protein E0L32_003366 [Thyridium curvatum]|uniref:U3 small nucleolar RNA-associated protein 11 n=1 Tax=Thyridium curvatum TaxID=1093900 RepID=A0A507BKR2_9PEZI|nr:uncharacterized protein E0L32_003366 [Thyridium curvatum]TPX17248.1 hypothetical protein E0L32_003366 [Thyridium curvatum]
MSSMRNAVQRRNHKERSQPKERERLGLLEKHKDYSLRAKDFNKKKAQLKSLRQKAADRNEDEFYFGMLSRKGPGGFVSKGKRWTGTVDGDRGNRAMDVDTVRLLKTQDVGYLRTMRNVLAKEVRELEQRAIMAGALADGAQDEDDEAEDEEEEFSAGSRRKPKKIVFVDDADEQTQAAGTGTGTGQDDDDMDLDSEDDDGAEAKDDSKKTEAERKADMAARLRRKLQNARKQLKALTEAENELELQRARMAKTATVGGITKAGKKFKIRERKR